MRNIIKVPTVMVMRSVEAFMSPITIELSVNIQCPTAWVPHAFIFHYFLNPDSHISTEDTNEEMFD